jgi:hypothetical protein
MLSQRLSRGAARLGAGAAAAKIFGNHAPGDGAVEAASGQKIEGSHADAVGAKDGQNRVDRPRKTELPSGMGLHCLSNRDEF